MEQLILVDEHDQEIGTMEKITAHREGRLHRAFSVFVFHPDGRLMLQQRAAEKYHCGGLWTNTCCSHPRPGEAIEAAAHRRLMEEMGFDCNLREVHEFVYKSAFPNGLTEHEYDHVLVGTWDGTPTLNPNEAQDWEWVTPAVLSADIDAHPEKYTPWFKMVLEEVLKKV